MSSFKLIIPDIKHEALNEYYRANESASHKRIRRALARLILREVRQKELQRPSEG